MEFGKPEIRILLIEDDAAFRSSLTRWLSRSFTVEEASSLAEAQEKLHTGKKPDLVITDIRLDEADATNKDGLVFIEEIHSIYPAMPIIVMTAYGSSQTVYSQRTLGDADAQQLGALVVLSKPFNFDELDKYLRKIIAGKVSGWRRPVKRLMSNWMPPLGVFAAFVICWEFLVRLLSIPEYLIPAPSRIWSTIYDNAFSLFKDSGITMMEAFLGFLIANFLSLIIAIGFCHARWFERSFYPYMIALKSVPVVAIAPLLVLWFGYGIFGKTVMAAIISFFPLVVNATVGLKSIDPEALDLMRSLSASKLQVLLKLRFPNALPYIFSALKISSALAVVGAIVGELTGAKMGIGFTIMIATFNIDTPMLFASIFTASAAGILFFGLVVLVEAIVSHKYGFRVLERR